MTSSESRTTRIRRERREPGVRYVEYSAFPRISVDQRERSGFTRDLSPSGLCLRVKRAEAPGSLLRVVVRDVDGRPTLETVARVAWTKPTRDGAWRIGLSLLGEGTRARGAPDAPRGDRSALRP